MASRELRELRQRQSFVEATSKRRGEWVGRRRTNASLDRTNNNWRHFQTLRLRLPQRGDGKK